MSEAGDVGLSAGSSYPPFNQNVLTKSFHPKTIPKNRKDWQQQTGARPGSAQSPPGSTSPSPKLICTCATKYKVSIFCCRDAGDQVISQPQNCLGLV